MEVALLMRDALALQQEGRLAEAIAKYQAVVSEQPDNFDALHMLGVAWFQSNQLELDGVVDGAIMPRERIETTARKYLDEFRSHMLIEEAEILPLASRLLEPTDWKKIDAAIRHFEDPLFGARTEQRYAALASQIVRQNSGAGAATR